MFGIKKRFQVAKCKVSLKLATARIKLMRNKKGAQVIQMRKELAQLLAAGDDRTARIRVRIMVPSYFFISALLTKGNQKPHMKITSLSSKKPVEVDDVKKPRHVHPKLPDFETLADRIYAITKMERQRVL